MALLSVAIDFGFGFVCCVPPLLAAAIALCVLQYPHHSTPTLKCMVQGTCMSANMVSATGYIEYTHTGGGQALTHTVRSLQIIDRSQRGMIIIITRNQQWYAHPRRPLLLVSYRHIIIIYTFAARLKEFTLAVAQQGGGLVKGL